MNMLTHQEYSMRLIELFMDDCVKDLLQGETMCGSPATLMTIDESDMKWIDRMIRVEDKNKLYFINHWKHAMNYVNNGEFILHARQTSNGSYYYELERILK